MSGLIQTYFEQSYDSFHRGFYNFGFEVLFVCDNLCFLCYVSGILVLRISAMISVQQCQKYYFGYLDKCDYKCIFCSFDSANVRTFLPTVGSLLFYDGFTTLF